MNKLAIIGFGNQAKAWALNLKDSKINFSIGLRANSKSFEDSKKLNFKSFDYLKESSQFSHFVILTPDETHFQIVKEILKQKPNASFIYAHGYSIIDSNILELSDKASHLLLAPKSIASELRFEYETQGKVPAVYSFEHNINKDNESYLLSLAKGIGITCLREASFKDETYADLFSEQSLLCSALPYLSLFSFNTLIRNGVSKEVAFFECFHELKSISSTLVKLGPEKFFQLISPNALLGSKLGSESLFNENYLKNLESLYSRISSHDFMQQVDKTDMGLLRDEVHEFWSKTGLQDCYNELKHELYE